MRRSRGLLRRCADRGCANRVCITNTHPRTQTLGELSAHSDAQKKSMSSIISILLCVSVYNETHTYIWLPLPVTHSFQVWRKHRKREKDETIWKRGRGECREPGGLGRRDERGWIRSNRDGERKRNSGGQKMRKASRRKKIDTAHTAAWPCCRWGGRTKTEDGEVGRRGGERERKDRWGVQVRVARLALLRRRKGKR